MGPGVVKSENVFDFLREGALFGRGGIGEPNMATKIRFIKECNVEECLTSLIFVSLKSINKF